MPRIPVVPEVFANPPAPFSAGAVADNVLYVSGFLPLDEQWQTVGIGDILVQTRQVCEHIKLVVETAGGTLEDVVFNSIFLRNIPDYAGMNQIYNEYFGVRPPARYCIQANLVPPDCLVEIASIAHLPKEGRG